MSKSPQKEAVPFIKWVGGKRQLQNSLLEVFKQSKWNSLNGTYFEPFLGGGAMLLAILNSTQSSEIKARVSDTNLNLLQVYRCIQSKKENLDSFASELERIENEFRGRKSEKAKKDFYLSLRDEYNCVKFRPGRPTVSKDHRTRLAALFVFLNKAGFNGIYRENKTGDFNVPFGKKYEVKLLDEQNMKLVRQALRKTRIVSGDYRKLLLNSKTRPSKGDLVYFDPPYEPVSQTSAFTAYTHSGFTEDDQKQLAQVAGKLAGMGCRVVISNSSARSLKDFYWKQGFKIYEIQASRLVSAKSAGRKPVTEIVVTNFKVSHPSLKLVPRTSFKNSTRG